MALWIGILTILTSMRCTAFVAQWSLGMVVVSGRWWLVGVCYWPKLCSYVVLGIDGLRGWVVGMRHWQTLLTILCNVVLALGGYGGSGRKIAHGADRSTPSGGVGGC